MHSGTFEMVLDRVSAKQRVAELVAELVVPLREIPNMTDRTTCIVSRQTHFVLKSIAKSDRVSLQALTFQLFRLGMVARERIKNKSLLIEDIFTGNCDRDVRVKELIRNLVLPGPHTRKSKNRVALIVDRSTHTVLQGGAFVEQLPIEKFVLEIITVGVLVRIRLAEGRLEKQDWGFS